jgi:hypothetical protein
MIAAITPVDEADNRSIVIPNFRGLGMARALELAHQRGLEVVVEGTGRAVAQNPQPGRAAKSVVCRISFSLDGK